MIVLTKRNGERFLLNHGQIACIETIPEVKITMMNHDFYLVSETVDEIMDKITEYNAKIRDIYREILIKDVRKDPTERGENI
ncbi:MAG: flagellar FlbD family protein [Firmicutes bacterium]|nr:flagellar FlbD family protein [Bacillota bacterium]